jgi:hypothetical protein
MNDIEQKALALVNEIERLRVEAEAHYDRGYYDGYTNLLEQHEAFKQEVSDAVVEYFGPKHLDVILAGHRLNRFIIPKPKPDPLVEAWIEATGNTVGMEPLNAALEARGLEIREKGK